MVASSDHWRSSRISSADVSAAIAARAHRIASNIVGRSLTGGGDPSSGRRRARCECSGPNAARPSGAARKAAQRGDHRSVRRGHALRRRAAQDARIHRAGDRVRQRGLPDARVAGQQHERPDATRCICQRIAQKRALCVAPDHLPAAAHACESTRAPMPRPRVALPPGTAAEAHAGQVAEVAARPRETVRRTPRLLG
jgi:hypothetical protein